MEEIESKKLTIVAVGSSKSTHVVSRISCFAKRGHKVYLLCDESSGLNCIEEVLPRVLPADSYSKLYFFFEFIAVKCLRLNANTARLIYSTIRLLKDIRPDVIHVHFAYNGWAWLIALMNICPVVVSVMGGDILFDEQGNPTPRGKRLTLQLLDRADLITSKSDRLTDILDKLGGFREKVLKVVWGVDLDRFQRKDSSKLRRRLGIPEKVPVILSPKILMPFYNIDKIVRAMPRVLSTFPNARLVITEYCADPVYRESILKQTRQLGIEENVVFVGSVAHDDMPAFYSMADLTVAVPSSDGLPQTLLEGMACRVPNILSRLPIYEEYVSHGETTYFVDIDSTEIAYGVITLLSDSMLRKKIADFGRSYVENNANYSKEVERMEKEYYRLKRKCSYNSSFIKRIKILYELLMYWHGKYN